MDQRARGMQFDGGIRDHPLDRLALCERLAKGVAGIGVGDGQIQRTLGAADGLRAMGQAAGVQEFPGQLPALADAADDLAGRYAHVFEQQFPGLVGRHQVERLPQPHARRAAVDQKTRHAQVFAIDPRAGKQLHEIGLVGAGDEDLGAVDDEIAAVGHGGGFHAGGVRAGLGLGQRKAGALVAANDRHQVLRLLAGIAVKQHRPKVRREDGRRPEGGHIAAG